ncbi:hypothetical protein DRO21_04230 [archaeon]|nr:MAG: hypothetical protein DRO21_04230 [archaeon]
MESVYTWVSRVLNPYAFPFISFIVIEVVHGGNLALLILGVIISSFLPAIIHLRWMREGRTNEYVSEIKCRIKLSIIVCLSDLVFGLALLAVRERMFALVLLSYSATTFLIFVFTRFIDKMSVHVSSSVTATAILFALAGYVAGLIMLAVTFVVAVSRYCLQAHTIAQLIEGFVLPIPLVYIVNLIVLSV